MICDKKSIRVFILAAIVSVLAGFTNGFLGAGGGIILLWLLRRVNPDKSPASVRDNFASVVFVVLLFSTVSAVSYSHRTNVDVNALLSIALPGVAGGVAGALLTDKLNTDILKLTFSVIIIIAGINMIR